MVFGVSLWPIHNTCRSKARLAGKTVIVTGGNTGIGKEVAKDLYKRGARAILMCRDLKKGQDAIDDIKRNVTSRSTNNEPDGEPGELALYQLNLASFASIKECARKVMQSEPALHILINNAGVMGHVYEKTEDGFETHFQVNHLGHFLLTILLLPKLEASSPGCRIINVSSALHYFVDIKFDDINSEVSYNSMRSYSRSKLANILFTRELVSRMKADNLEGINVYALHPGVVKTELGRHVDRAFFSGARSLFHSLYYFGFLKSSFQGAQTTLHCALDEKAGEETGLYYSECKAIRPSSTATNPETQTRLWDVSCKFLDLNPKLGLRELSKQAAEKANIQIPKKQNQ